MYRLLFTTVLLLLPYLGMAEEGGPDPIEIPDIRANIMKMLQQKGERSGSSIVQTPEPAQPEPPAAGDLFDQAKRQMEQPSERNNAPTAPTVTAPEPPEAPVQPGLDEKPRSSQPYVPLPSKQITIEDLDDLEELQWEIDEAKKRQREQ